MAAVNIEFISAGSLAGKTSDEKISFILSNVKQDKILVLEESLSPQEEKQLISRTMSSISKKFPGIEVSSLGFESDDLRTRLIKFLGGKTSGLMVVGPSNLIKKIKRDPDKIRLRAGA